MAAPELKCLGYIGYDVTAPRAWDDFLQSVYGLERRADSTRSTARYRLDGRHHRITTHAARRDRVRYMGWEVASREDLAAFEERLRERGVSVRRASPAQLAERAVQEMIAFEDADGHRMELFFCAAEDRAPFRPARPLAGFVTGEGGLGHVVVHCRDVDAAAAWYQEVLGFKLSDYIYWDEARATFMHLNPRHHSLALVNECFGLEGGDFNHLMLEAREMNDVGRAYDIVQARGYPIAFTLGRHTNDDMLSFYLYTPSGHLIEYGYGGRLVDTASWEPKFYDAPAWWGHHVHPPPKRWPVRPR